MILVYVETSAERRSRRSRSRRSPSPATLSEAGNGVPIDAVSSVRRRRTLPTELASYGVRNVHHASGDDFELFSGAATATAVDRRP